jgi:exosortase
MAGLRPSLGSDLVRLWEEIPDKGLFLAVLAAWVLVFQVWGNSTFGVFGRPTPSLFEWMYLVYTTTPDDFHGLLVLPGVLVLLYVKRKDLLAAPKQNWWPAMALVLLAALLHLAGYLVQQPRVSIVAFFLGVYGLTGLVWGRHWLAATFFPMFLFAFCVPLTALADPLTLPLRQAVSQAAVFISRTLLGIAVLRDGVQIFSPTGSYQYEVAAACSGLHSLLSMFGLTTVYAFLCFKSHWRKLAILASAVPLALLGNVLRLTVVIVVSEAFGKKAGLAIETNFGFVTFLLGVVGVLVLGWWLDEGRATRPARTEGQPA